MIDPTIISVAVPVSTAIIGGVSGWLIRRADKAPDMQAALADAVAEVVKYYKSALLRSDAELLNARSEASSLRDEISELRMLLEMQTQKIDDQSLRMDDQSRRLIDQSEEIGRLTTHIRSLEQQVLALGGRPVERKRAARAAHSGGDA